MAKAHVGTRRPTGGRTFPNTARGHVQLLGWLAALPGAAHLVCEATGGYERAVVVAGQAAGLAMSIVNPRAVRALAQARGLSAKTDALDAALLRDYGVRLKPAPARVPSAAQTELATLASGYQYVIASIVREQGYREHLTHALLLRQQAARLRQLERQRDQLETDLAHALATDPALRQRAGQLEQVQGIGRKTAISLLAFLPELGTLRPGQAAALAGVAPFNRDSGKWHGKRLIQGGLAVRRALYMAALTASQRNPVLALFYQRLISHAANPPRSLSLPSCVTRRICQPAPRSTAKYRPCTP